MNHSTSVRSGHHFVLTAAAMREADRITIEALGIPGLVLMESAGRAATQIFVDWNGDVSGKVALCFCGKGNNGGDGLVVARTLLANGAKVVAITFAEVADMSADAALNFRILQKMADRFPPDQVRFQHLRESADLDHVPEGAFIVDALLGTGLTSALRPPISDIVDWINNRNLPILSLDIPTGLESDNGRVAAQAVKADLTVTMGAAKTGFYFKDGPLHTGCVKIADIGIPAIAVKQAAQTAGCALLTEDRSIKAVLPTRGNRAHKYRVGLAMVVGGSEGLTGAPAMASQAAASVGAGAVVCACADTIQPILAQKMTEVMSLPLPTDSNGIVFEEAWQAMESRRKQVRAWLVGPGLGSLPGTQTFVVKMLSHIKEPAVVDADALNALADNTSFFAKHANGSWILTPHMGEFRRITGEEHSNTNPVKLAQTWAKKLNCVLLLKGLPSVLAAPSGETFICGTGNAALATAGTGDVLAGMCVGFLAQGLSPVNAALAAMHLGGAAADHYRRNISPAGMIATDMIKQLPSVFKHRFG